MESTGERLAAATHEFVFDKNQKYSCTDCPAKCCRLPWQIDMTAAERQRMLDVPWIVDVLKQHGVDFLPLGENYLMPRVRHASGDQACVFLGEDYRCTIHAREGHEVLPVTCQIYPFATFVADYPAEGEDRPVKLYPYTSVFCPSIAQNYGSPVTDLIDEKYNTFLKSKKIHPLPESIQVGGVALGKKSYLALSDALQGLFDREDWSVSQALWQGRRLIWRVVLAGLNQQDLSADGIGDLVENFLSEPEVRGLPVAEPGNLTGRTVVSFELVNFMLYELAHDKIDESGTGFTFRFLQMLFDLVGNKGEYRVWNLERAVDLKAAMAVRLDESDPVFQEELRKYYRGIFFKKRILLRDPDLMKSYFMLAGSYAAILRVARWMAYAEGADTVNRKHLLDAIGYVDVRVSSVKWDTSNWLGKIQLYIYEMLATREQAFCNVLLSESYGQA